MLRFKVLILCLICVAITSCDKTKNIEQTTTVNFIRSERAGSAEIIISGRAGNSEPASSFILEIPSEGDSLSIELPNGDWNFNAIGWPGEKMSGNLHCSQPIASQSLTGITTSIALQVDKVECWDSPFNQVTMQNTEGTPVDTSDDTILPLTVVTCEKLKPDTKTKSNYVTKRDGRVPGIWSNFPNLASYCSSNVGSFRSFKVIVPLTSLSEDQNIFANVTNWSYDISEFPTTIDRSFESQCFNVTDGAQYNTGLQLTLGDPEQLDDLMFHPILMAFTAFDCEDGTAASTYKVFDLVDDGEVTDKNIIFDTEADTRLVAYLFDQNYINSYVAIIEWDFSASGDYTYNSNYVEVIGGGAVLKQLDLITDTDTEWNAGSKIGVTASGNSLLLNANTNYSELDALWTPQYSNLLGYWKMNESSWTTGTTGQVIDYSGNGKHATPFGGAATSTTAKLGDYSGLFNGSSSYVAIPTTGGAFEPSIFSITAWVSLNQLSVGHVVFSRQAGSSVYESMALYITSGANKAFFGVGDGTNQTYVEGTTSLEIGKWYHLMGIFDGTSIHLYVNGILEVSDTVGHSVVHKTASGVHLGAEDNTGALTPNTSYFNGSIDEVAIWDVALTSEEVYKIYARQSPKYSGSYYSEIFDCGEPSSWNNFSWLTPLPFGKELPGNSGNELQADYSSLVNSSGVAGDSDLSASLVGLWRFNETEFNSVRDGEDIEDFSGCGHHGTDTAGVTLGGKGVFNKSAYFDGTNDMVLIDSTSELRPANNFTISAWVKIATQGVYQLIIGHRDNGDGDDGWLFRIEADNTVGLLALNTPGSNFLNQKLTSNQLIEKNKWYHLVGIYDASYNLKIYINGTLDASKLAAGDVVYEVLNYVEIGTSGNGQQHQLKGYIDEIAFWNRTLTPAEILELYRRGANRITYQVRSCSSSDCSDQDALTGDGWIGPGGDYQTYFSELHNNGTIDGSGNPIGSVLTTIPYLSSPDFVTTPSSNQYFQWRSILESDDEDTACSGSQTCMPEIQQVSLLSRTGDVFSGSEIAKYFGGVTTVENSVAYSFTELLAITIVKSGDCTMTFRLSNDGGTTYYYYNSGSWQVSADDSQASSQADIETNITSFPVGNGQFKFRAVMDSDSDQNCELQSVSLF